MMIQPTLVADQVSLDYDSQRAVNSVSISIPDGQITTIIGPNGCGKSTLLRALARVKKADEGAVLLDGQLIQHFPTKDVARKLGLLAQSATVPAGLSVRELAMRGRYPHQSFLQTPSEKDRLAVESALERTGILDLADRPVDQLSGGQRQRAWIAMALAQDTPIMLLDEPTTYLDLAHQLQVVELIRALNAEDGRTIVTVLHDVNEAARISHHIIALKDGRVIAEGTPEEVITPEILSELFGISCDVIASPGTGRPYCLPRSRHDFSAESLAAAEAVFEVDALQTGYGGISVLRGLSCQMPSGNITGIVGPNACGKSTLLRACSRLLLASSGEVRIEGRDVRKGKHRDFSRKLALMAQSPAMPTGYEVEDLISIGRMPHQGLLRQWRREDESAVQLALEQCDLCDLRNRPIETLSGGQRQRAWFGMALAQDTPVLLLDEPTTFLDLAAQIEMLDLVKEMNRRDQRSVVMVLHDLNLAARYCDYLIVMKDGDVVVSGTPRAVLTIDLLHDVFEIEAEILTDPESGSVVVLPLRAVDV